jgi:hypothetical protein
MWMPTRIEAVEIYAQFWTGRYGMTASSSARKMANRLERKGDLDGHKIWNEVADVIDRREKIKTRLTVLENVTAVS